MKSAAVDHRMSSDSYSDVSDKVKGMIIIRLLSSIIILLIFTLVQYPSIIEPEDHDASYRLFSYPIKGLESALNFADFFNYIALVLCVLSLIYLIYFPRCTDMHFFAHVQLTIDLFIMTAIIYFLGGSTCPFTLLYIMIIIASSVILGGNSSLHFAAFCSLHYLWLVFAGFFHLPVFGYQLPIQLTELSKPDLAYFMTANLGGFFAVGILSKIATGSLQNATDLLLLHTHEYEDLRFRHNYIIQSIQIGVMTINLKNEISLLNKEGEKLLGVSESDVKGKNLDVLFPERLTRRVRKLIGDQESLMAYQEELNYKREEQTIPLRFTISLLTDETNQKRGILLLFQDIIQLRSLEMQRQMTERWASVAELASSIAHELRNPLAALTGSIELLRVKAPIDGREQKLMNVMLRESKRLDNLVTDFLNYSRPMTLKFDQRDINEILEEILMVIRSGQVDPNPITFQFTSTMKEIVARIDRERVYQVFWNLIRNAQEAMPDGGFLKIQTSYSYFLPFPSTLISKTELERESIPVEQKDSIRFAWIRIMDTGVGINPENLKSIFNPFTSYKPRGTGLGLAISYRIVEGHSGHISVETEVGKGTTFHVLLPTQPIEREILES